jgi:N utilization substance protein A
MSTSANDKAKAAQELLRGVETMQREKNIPAEMVFAAIERAIRLAIGKHFGDEDDVVIAIDRQRGFIDAKKGEQVIDVHSGSLGRIAAQAAKQQMIQLFREVESESLLVDLERLKGQLLPTPGTVQRLEGGAAIVSIGKTEAILPRGEQIPGETHHVGEKIKSLVLEVKKAGHRVKVILSRSSPLFVQRLFEKEIPEIEDRTIKIERVAREAGYRTKVAVSSIDMRVDCVGACVGVRGSRIKNIVEELGGVERIDIVRWNDSIQVLIQNALQPATIEEVFLYDRLQRAIVLVKEDQLSLAIGRRGQNVRLASKLVDWDIEIMTHDELNTTIEKAEMQFSALPGAQPELVDALIEEGFLSYEDIAVLTPAEMCEMGGMDEDTAAEMISFAEYEAEEMEREGKPGKVREPVAVPQTQSPAPLGRPAPADQPSEARQAFENLFSGAPAETTEEMPLPAEGTESGEPAQEMVEAPPIETPSASPPSSEELEPPAQPVAVEPVAEPVAAAAEPPAQPQGSESPPSTVE